MAVANSWPHLAQTGRLNADEYFRARAGLPRGPAVMAQATPPAESGGIVISGWDALRSWAPRKRKDS